MRCHPPRATSPRRNAVPAFALALAVSLTGLAGCRHKAPPAGATVQPAAVSPASQIPVTGHLVSALNMDAIHFEAGSARISAQDRDQLERLAAVARGVPAGMTIEIGGYADSALNPAADRALSLQRAEAVRNRLIELGVPASALRARGHGADPAHAGNEASRIEFTIAP